LRITASGGGLIREQICQIAGHTGRDKKERGARQLHKRLLYCVNVNRTSLDHLLLGESADIDN